MNNNKFIQIEQAALPFMILLGVFIGAYIMGPLLAHKVIQVGFLVTTAGVLSYSLTFLCTDIVSEIYGSKNARLMIFSGLAAYLATILMAYIVIFWPAAETWSNQEVFNEFFATSSRFFIAGVVSYLITQLADVYLFHKIRTHTNGKFLWLRNTVSTSLSAFLDVSLFLLIAFAGVMSWGQLWTISWGAYIIRIIIALADTPLAYAGVHLLRSHIEKKKYH